MHFFCASPLLLSLSFSSYDSPFTWEIVCAEVYSLVYPSLQVGDFGILVRSGFSVTKALFFNFLSALLALAGTALVSVNAIVFVS